MGKGLEIGLKLKILKRKQELFLALDKNQLDVFFGKQRKKKTKEVL